MRVMIIESTTPVEDIGTVEMLLLAKSELRTLDEGYQELGLETPEWISEKQLDVAKEITSRVRAELTRQLKAYKARRAAEAPKEERLSFLDTKITELEKKLG